MLLYLISWSESWDFRDNFFPFWYGHPVSDFRLSSFAFYRNIYLPPPPLTP
jgi:hypothetical protein